MDDVVGAVSGPGTRAVNKYGLVTFVQKRIANPVVRSVLLRGWRIPGYALLETTGRRSGQPRRTPVGDGLDGDVFWIVSEHGHRSDYVRNIQVEPRVRVRVRGRWRSGTAAILLYDDPQARQRLLGQLHVGARVNALAVRSLGTNPVTIRIDLDRGGAESTALG